MKVLWLTNGPIPEASLAFGLPVQNVEGWKIQIFERLSHDTAFDAVYLFPSGDVASIEYREKGGIRYATFDRKRSSTELKVLFGELLAQIKPDVIHIWGTEYVHTYAMTEAAKETGMEDRSVISIQGLSGMCAYHYMGNIPGKVQVSFTLRDLLKRDTLLSQQKRFERQGEYEQKALQNVRHVIGRTFWDRICTGMLNPGAEYHFNNETLRAAFYQNEWDIEKAEKHSIFVTQAYYPLKGFHNVLAAAALLKNKYPDLKIYVSGADNAFITGFRQQAYGRYVQRLIRDNHLEEQVVFLGSLNEEQMVRQYLKSNVFVSLSSIENSPNSVGEAMLLGMPVIASNVGGVSDLLKAEEEGFLYQADAPYLLAHYLDRFFTDPALQVSYGKKAREHAQKTHDFETNYRTLTEIYMDIAKKAEMDGLCH